MASNVDRMLWQRAQEQRKNESDQVRQALIDTRQACIDQRAELMKRAKAVGKALGAGDGRGAQLTYGRAAWHLVHSPASGSNRSVPTDTYLAANGDIMGTVDKGKAPLWVRHKYDKVPRRKRDDDKRMLGFYERQLRTIQEHQRAIERLAATIGV